MRLILIADVGGAATFHVGDEAMLEADVLLARQRFPLAELMVVTRAPRETHERLGVNTLRFSTPAPDLVSSLPLWLEQARVVADGRELALTSGDVVWLAGGGNLTSTWPHLVAERLLLARQAASVGARIIVTGQTIGPALDGMTGAWIRELLVSAHAVSVRDLESLALCRGLGLDVSLFPDDALLLADGEPDHAERLNDVMAVTIHPFAAWGDPQMLSLVSQLRASSRSCGLRLVFVPHMVGREGHDLSDVSMAERLADATGGDIHESLEPAEVARTTRAAECVISTRYHPIVWATSAGKPALALPCDGYTRAKMLGALSFASSSHWSMWLENAAAGLLEPAVAELAAARVSFRERRASVVARLARLNAARETWIAGAIEGKSLGTVPMRDKLSLETRPTGSWTLAANPTDSHLPARELMRERDQLANTVAALRRKA